ncbi:MAG: hypothetical protein L6R41_004765 [Letrouitia leprolyta]|nr:MAG: hypothetical protein L6R41_004765 [Letrouitia leprolyta]
MSSPTAIQPFVAFSSPEPSFLSLPPTVRRMIYSYLFTPDDVLRHNQPIPKKNFTTTIANQGILMVCKLIHKEAMAVLFSMATVRIYLENKMQDQFKVFERLVPTPIFNSITKPSLNVQRGRIANDLWTYDTKLDISPESLRAAIKRFPGIEVLEINCKILYWAVRPDTVNRLAAPTKDFSYSKKIPVHIMPEFWDKDHRTDCFENTFLRGLRH